MKRPIRISEMSEEKGYPRYPHVQVERVSQEVVPDRRVPARTRKPTQRFTFNLREESSVAGVSWLRLVD
jgi:hypothetical protein